AQLRRRGHRCRTGGRGGGRPSRRRRPRRRPRRGAPGRRRMRLLRLHALEGAAAPGRAPGREPADTGRGGGGHRQPLGAGGARPARSDHPRPRRRRAGPLARGQGDHASARQRPLHRRARGRGRREAPPGAPGRLRGDRQRSPPAADPRARREPPVDEPRGDHGQGGAGAPAGHGRRRGRLRDGAGLADAGLPGDVDRGREPDPVARGDLRLRARHGRADRAGRRRPDESAREAGGAHGFGRHRDPERRLGSGGRRAAGRGRAPTARRRARSRRGRRRRRRAAGDRRAPAGDRPALAVRHRRRQRPRPVHPHGQVPGADRHRSPARASQCHSACRRRRAVPAGDLHRPPGRRRRAHNPFGRRRGTRRHRRRRADVRQRRRIVLRTRRAGKHAGAGRPRPWRAGRRDVHGRRGRRDAARGDGRHRGRGAAGAPASRGARLPDAHGAVAPDHRRTARRDV
ncbi:MAG: PF00070 family, FAD-dependent NAD(P)-disulphide oxidoreductase, partial [uncultured Solirubrobacteraceae bacterium]